MGDYVSVLQMFYRGNILCHCGWFVWMTPRGGTLTEKRPLSECQKVRNVMHLMSVKGFSDLWVIQTTPPLLSSPSPRWSDGISRPQRGQREIYFLINCSRQLPVKTERRERWKMETWTRWMARSRFYGGFFYSGMMPKAATIWHTSRSLVRPERREKGGTERKKRKRVTDGKQDRFCGDGGSSVCAAAALLCQITEWRSVIISLIGALPQEAKGGGGGRGPKGGGVTSLIAGKMVW